MNTNYRITIPTGLAVILFVTLAVTFTSTAESVFETIQNTIVARVGWFYIVAVAVFLGFMVWLLISPFAKIRLGKDEERPQYRNATWFSMLFSAGTGVGIVFFGVAEPILHFVQPPTGEGGTEAAAQRAMGYAFLHWGLHGWAIFGIVGLALAYFSFRHDLPLTIRSTLYPLLGKRIEGGVGDFIDGFAALATIFGIATTLGFGAMQVNAGLDYLGVVGFGVGTQLVLIAGLTLAATASAISGLDRGVRRLSQFNLTIAILLMIFVLIAGPTAFLISSFVQSIGHYLQNFPTLTFQTGAFQGPEWQRQWTMFFWGWWISWSPFVGMFIARISRGRTIRSFVGGVLLVPSGFTFIWLVVFGNTAIHAELFGSGGVANAVLEDTSKGLFALLELLPLSTVTIALALTVIATFFVTSADSGSLVLDRLTSGGTRSVATMRAFWTLIVGGVAMALLMGGGMLALQTAAITTAVPFTIILLAMCRSLLKGMRAEAVKDSMRRVEEL